MEYKDSEGVERVSHAHLTIVCDGMYSNLRKRLCEPKVRMREAVHSGCSARSRVDLIDFSFLVSLFLLYQRAKAQGA